MSWLDRLAVNDPTLDTLEFRHNHPDACLWTRFRFQHCHHFDNVEKISGKGRGDNEILHEEEEVVEAATAAAQQHHRQRILDTLQHTNSTVHTICICDSFLTHLDVQTPSAFLDSITAPHLTTLELRGDGRTTTLSIYSVARIITRHAATLQRLVLRHFFVTPDAVNGDSAATVLTATAQALQQATHLVHLEIHGVIFPWAHLATPLQWQSFWKALSTKLETLSLNGNWRGLSDDRERRRLSQHLQHEQYRQQPQNNNNHPGSQHAWIQLLTTRCPRLQVLRLQDWYLQRWEWSHLWQGVAASTTLHTLDLTDSTASRWQLSAVADALEANQSLRMLNLTHVAIRDVDNSLRSILIYIVETIRHGQNETLQQVSFSPVAAYETERDLALLRQMTTALAVYTGWNRSGFRRQLPAADRGLWAVLLAKAAASHDAMVYHILQRNVQALFR